MGEKHACIAGPILLYQCILALHGGGEGRDGNSKGVGKNSVMTPYDYTVRAYLANIKNAIDLGAKCTTGQGEIAE